jgi:hypothetical protein
VHPCATAQVGIRTENPQGMFHVDAMGNTAGSSGTGDDVIVTLEGNVGIGAIPTANPPARLLITDGGTSTTPKSPLRIVDGNQEGGKVLTATNANGDARWELLPGTGIPGESYGLSGIPAQTIHEHQNNNTLYDVGFNFKAPVAGFYAFEIRWWGVHRDGQSAVTYCILHYRLLRNGGNVDEYETYLTLNGTDASHFCTCFTLYSQAGVNDVFTMQARPSYYMNTEANPSTPWTQAKVNILRLY